MKLVDMKEFMGESGMVDWGGLDAARIENGEKCYECGGLILLPSGVRTLCRECCESQRSSAWESRNRVRCPRCGHVRRASEFCSLDPFGEESEHVVDCVECDHSFEIVSSVTVMYLSPTMEVAK